MKSMYFFSQTADTFWSNNSIRNIVLLRQYRIRIKFMCNYHQINCLNDLIRHFFNHNFQILQLCCGRHSFLSLWTTLLTFICWERIVRTITICTCTHSTPTLNSVNTFTSESLFEYLLIVFFNHHSIYFLVPYPIDNEIHAPLSRLSVELSRSPTNSQRLNHLSHFVQLFTLHLLAVLHPSCCSELHKGLFLFLAALLLPR